MNVTEPAAAAALPEPTHRGIGEVPLFAPEAGGSTPVFTYHWALTLSEETVPLVVVDLGDAKGQETTGLLRGIIWNQLTSSPFLSNPVVLETTGEAYLRWSINPVVQEARQNMTMGLRLAEQGNPALLPGIGAKMKAAYAAAAERVAAEWPDEVEKQKVGDPAWREQLMQEKLAVVMARQQGDKTASMSPGRNSNLYAKFSERVGEWLQANPPYTADDVAAGLEQIRAAITSLDRHRIAATPITVPEVLKTLDDTTVIKVVFSDSPEAAALTAEPQLA